MIRVSRHSSKDFVLPTSNPNGSVAAWPARGDIRQIPKELGRGKERKKTVGEEVAIETVDHPVWRARHTTCLACLACLFLILKHGKRMNIIRVQHELCFACTYRGVGVGVGVRWRTFFERVFPHLEATAASRSSSAVNHLCKLSIISRVSSKHRVSVNNHDFTFDTYEFMSGARRRQNRQ